MKNRLTQVVGEIFTQVAKLDKYAQVSVPKEVKRHGEKALNALLAEYGQMHGHGTFQPLMSDTLTSEQRKNTL